jgi:hypothetical protein
LNAVLPGWSGAELEKLEQSPAFLRYNAVAASCRTFIQRMRIFISYRREDSAGHTGRLFDSLRSRFGEKNVFFDLSGIDSGQVFSDAIQQAIRSADVVLAIIGREWLTCERNGQRRLDDPGDLVRAEITTALEQQVPVIPVLVEGTTVPAEQVLPAPLRPLVRRDAHEITDDRWTYDVDRLVTAMEKLAGSRGTRLGPRWAVAAGVAAIVLAVVVAVFYVRTPGADPAEPGPRATVSPPAAELAGTWTAAVQYPWGVDATERFVFTVDRATLSGSASFLGVPRGIVEGVVEGERIRFQTRTSNLENQRITHTYTGRFARERLELTMQSDGTGTDEPITFTASRAVAE